MHVIAIRYGAVTKQGQLSLALLKNPVGKKLGGEKAKTVKKGQKKGNSFAITLASIDLKKKIGKSSERIRNPLKTSNQIFFKKPDKKRNFWGQQFSRRLCPFCQLFAHLRQFRGPCEVEARVRTSGENRGQTVIWASWGGNGAVGIFWFDLILASMGGCGLQNDR